MQAGSRQAVEEEREERIGTKTLDAWEGKFKVYGFNSSRASRVIKKNMSNLSFVFSFLPIFRFQNKTIVQRLAKGDENRSSVFPNLASQKIDVRFSVAVMEFCSHSKIRNFVTLDLGSSYKKLSLVLKVDCITSLVARCYGPLNSIASL